MNVISKIVLCFIAIPISFISGLAIGYKTYSEFDAIGWADAVHVYRMEAENGNPESQYWLGRYILEGKGVTPNPEEAFHWFEKSSNKGYLKAQLELAQMYERGHGVRKDEAMALQLYLRAAENAVKRLQDMRSKK